MVEVRSVPAADREQFDRILQYAFSPHRGPGVDDERRVGREGEWPPTLGRPHGLYDGDRLCSTVRLYELPGVVRGRETTVGGVGGVATLPEHRRQGYVRRLLAESLRRYRADGVEFAALWPFSTPFYESLGWATAYSYTRLTTPPSELPTHDAAGECRQLAADDWARLSRAAARHDEGATFTVRRTETWWREMVFDDEGWQAAPYCYGYERDGDLVGALLYTVDDEASTLRVRNLLAADEEARRALLSFLGSHDAQVDSVLVRGAPDATLLTRLDDPEPATCEVQRGPMVRLTDLAALERFDWPGTADCRLAVTDPLGVTEGVVRFRVADGETAVTRVGDSPDATETDTDATDVDATVGVGTLSQLAVGAHDVETARQIADLRVETDETATALASVFRPGRVRLRQFF